MAELALPRNQRGFSLVEMVIAVAFVAILMAGMAGVFKSSISTFYTAGEKVSSSRRNRSSIDMLYDDLNSAGMFLTDLGSQPTGLGPSNPPFYVLPNQAVAGAGPDDPQFADQVFFYFDQPLPFEGSLTVAGTTPANTASQLVMQGIGPVAGQDDTYVIDCKDPSYAAQIQPGHAIIFKDFWEAPMAIKTATYSGKSVTVTVTYNPGSYITGVGPTGAPPKAAHIDKSGVVFYAPAQMVRYSVQMLQLDPISTVKIPCLVRDQGPYSNTGFTPAVTPQIITENIQAFRVFLSCNAGTSWAPTAATTTSYGNNPSMAVGWNTGIVGDLNTQLAASGRQGYTSIGSSLIWFRSIPTLVRVDLTTRTAIKRSEYAATANGPAAYNLNTQSLVLVPRHFGLPLTY